MDGRVLLERAVATVGVVGLLVTLPFYLASGLAAPLWAIVVLMIFWLVLLITAFRWFTSRPWLVLLIPFLAVAVWFGAMTLGEQVLGWQA